MITTQAAYEKMRAHAATMTAPAVNRYGLCRYRSPNGPCLIGVLISDAEAERGDALCLGVQNLASPELAGADIQFLFGAQCAHDGMVGNFSAANLVRALDYLAVKHGLKPHTN